MKIIATSKTLSTLVATAILAASTLASNAQQAGPALDMTPVHAESVGFSPERLENLHALMQKAVDEKQVAGVVTILARHGKVVDYRTYGRRDLAGGPPMSKDTIFRDYSMTKPVTGVAMMILYEQGKWLPSDPIAKFIPEFAHLKVFDGTDADGKPILVDPDHAPTMHELMSHTAGFTYGSFGASPVDKMYQQVRPLESASLKEFIDKMATLPLLFQPGKGWNYSVSMDIEGYIVEKLSGQTLPDFYRDHIFKPLGMKDAGFFVPADKVNRLAALYTMGSDSLLVAKTTGGPYLPPSFTLLPTMPSGGGGMVSTAEDYYRFASMLLGQGQLGGTRILAPATVKLMTSNHLHPDLLTGKYRIGLQVMRPGFGYGYNGAVEFDPAEANLPDGKGTYLWDGAAGTWFWVDPSNDVVFIGMIQRMGNGPDTTNLQYESRAVVYGALVDPVK